MANVDTRLVNPTATQLEEALRQAANVVNGKARSFRLPLRLEGDPGALATGAVPGKGWRRWAADEGKGHSSTVRSLLFLVWWSDGIGRRHFRIVARRGVFDR